MVALFTEAVAHFTIMVLPLATNLTILTVTLANSDNSLEILSILSALSLALSVMLFASHLPHLYSVVLQNKEFAPPKLILTIQFVVGLAMVIVWASACTFVWVKLPGYQADPLVHCDYMVASLVLAIVNIAANVFVLFAAFWACNRANQSIMHFEVVKHPGHNVTQCQV